MSVYCNVNNPHRIMSFLSESKWGQREASMGEWNRKVFEQGNKVGFQAVFISCRLALFFFLTINLFIYFFFIPLLVWSVGEGRSCDPVIRVRNMQTQQLYTRPQNKPHFTDNKSYSVRFQSSSTIWVLHFSSSVLFCTHSILGEKDIVTDGTDWHAAVSLSEYLCKSTWKLRQELGYTVWWKYYQCAWLV